MTSDTPADMPTREEVERRINDYLGNGGLFNPELMDHSAVRDLLRDCRTAFAKLTAERDMLLRREAETIARYDAKLDTAERERDEARADRAEGMREGMEDAADRVENFWPRAAEHIRAAMEKE